MQVVQSLSELASLTRPCAVAIGNYDGVHLGHQAILRSLQQAAPHLPLTVVTFEPTPKEFFAPESAPPRLTHLADKLTRLAHCGVDQVAVLPFDAQLAAMTPEAFVQTVLVKGLQTQILSVGRDYRYGANRVGDIYTLAPYAFELKVHDNVLNQDERISSTRIRQALQVGAFEQAAALLGEPYWLTGTVSHGQKVGRTLGFPTMNIDLQGQRLALSGVYAVSVAWLNETRPSETCLSGPCSSDTGEEPADSHYGVANYGSRPTVDNGRPSLEIHLFDFDKDVYGQRCRVKFHYKIRNEQRFDGLPALQQQIRQDAQTARQWFAAAPALSAAS